MKRCIRPLAASAALALPLLASAGCNDSRLGGNDGNRPPGDNPAPSAKATNPSNPEIGGAAGKAGDTGK